MKKSVKPFLLLLIQINPDCNHLGLINQQFVYFISIEALRTQVLKVSENINHNEANLSS